MNKTLITTLKKWREFRHWEKEEFRLENERLEEIRIRNGWDHLVSTSGSSYLNTKYEKFMDWWVKQAEGEGILDGEDN